MANHISHSALPYPIKNALFSLEVGFRVAAGTPTDPTTPDSEISSDGGATFADCTNEITTGGTTGAGYITLTSTEMNNSAIWIAAKSANCLTTLIPIVPRVLASVGTGTLSAGSAGGGTLGTLLAYDVTGCFIKTTGGTGGAAGALQARKIITYNTSTGAFTVAPNWETTPDATTTYDVLLPEGVTLGMLRALNPTTSGRTLDVTTTGAAGIDWGNVENQSTSVNLSATTTNLVNTVTTYTGNTLQTGDSFARIGANGVGLTAVALADSTSDAVIADAVWNAATATYGAAGSYGLLIETDLDATISSRLATAGYTAPSNLTAAQIATGVWTDTTAGDFTTAGSIGKSVMNGVALGTGLTIVSVSGAVGSVTGAVGSVTGAVGSVTGAVGSVTGAVGSVTGNVGGNVVGTVASVVTKTGYSLAATGLDAITVTAPSTVASTFPEMVVQLWRRFFKKSTMTSTQLKTYADNGTTLVTTQTVSDDGTTQTQDAAS